MIDCSWDLRLLHDEHVQLPEAVQEKLRGHRDANRDRVKKGLKDQKGIQPNRFVIQGSYDMETIIQHPKNDYDIDDGAVFKADDLHGPQGGMLTPLQVRQMVCEVVQDARFKRAPEVRTNCVRVYYEEGYNVDIPVYREVISLFGETSLELASVEWRKSDPKAVTEWFNNQVQSKSPEENGTRQQMRRQVRFLKAFATSRESWNMPSGFILSVLVSDKYQAHAGRDDVSFYETIRGIHSRLQWDMSVKHPIMDEYLTKTSEDPQMAELKTQLGQALEWLDILNDANNCTKTAALKAWGKVFNTDFFEQRGNAGGKGSGPTAFTISGGQPSAPVRKEGGGRYG